MTVADSAASEQGSIVRPILSRRRASTSAPTISVSPRWVCRRSTRNAESTTSASPPGWGLKKREEYTANDYHKPSDVIKPDWKMDGDVEDTQFYLDVGERVANSLEMPQWSAESEFKAMRDKLPEQ